MTNIRDVIALSLGELSSEKKTVDLRYPEVNGSKQVEITL